MTDRRTVLGGGLAMGLFATAGFGANLKGNDMYGLIGKIKATPGKRPDLMAILGEGTGAMPGNLAYIIAEDMADPDGIWVTEAWTDKGAHAASLKLPAVQQAIARARPLIAGFEAQHEIRPVSGIPAHSA